MPFTTYAALFGPSDLALMKAVFDQLCEERHLAANDTDERDDLAAEIVRAFQRGIVSEKALWRSLSKAP